MTKKLYYDSSYVTEWETKCLKTFERDGEYFVVLEKTAFYPHGGGQPCDEGTINGILVLDVIDEENEVLHKVEQFPETSIVSCKINWEKRFDHMQQHSGQHLLSATCLDLYNSRTVSFHLGQDYVSIDVDSPKLNHEQVLEIEKEVNKRIYQNRPIRSYFVTNEELKEISLVKMPKVTENIRIVEIEGIEYNACGGTHVEHTGEIGLIKILKVEKQKDFTRIYFKCGNRVLEDFNEALSILGTFSSKFNTGRSDILDRFEKWEQEQKKLETQVDLLKGKLEMYQMKELLAQTKGNLLSHIFEDQSLKDLQRLALRLAEENNVLILFASTLDNKIVFTHNGTHALSCGKLFKEYLLQFNGKGGGNDKSAQAGFSSHEDMLHFFGFLSDMVK